MVLSQTKRRSGVTLVEFGVVVSVTLFLLLALIVGGMGVFRYQEVAHLAREGARYAATHGGQYHRDGIDKSSGVSQISSSSDLRTYLLTKTTLLDSSKLTVTVSWSGGSTNMPTYLDTDPTLIPPGQKVIRNYVSVTVSYDWSPELFLVGPFTLKSTSVMPMAY